LHAGQRLSADENKVLREQVQRVTLLVPQTLSLIQATTSGARRATVLVGLRGRRRPLGKRLRD
jgi:hypothetical protein